MEVKHRDIVRQRKSKLTRRQQRKRWMARLILIGLTLMLAISISLTLWPPLPDTRNADQPTGAPEAVASDAAANPPGQEDGAPGDANDQAGGPLDNMHLDIFHEFGWQPPGTDQPPGAPGDERGAPPLGGDELPPPGEDDGAPPPQ